jgi:CspA family cold shock protein
VITKLFGFLTREDGVDFFVHFSNIVMEGYKVLEKEQKVTFEVGMDPNKNKQHAINVTPVI